MTCQYWHTSSSVHPFVQAWNTRALTRTLLSACACSRRRQTSCVWLWKGCWTPCWPWPCPPRPSPSPHTPFTWPYPHPPRRACFETSVCWAHVAFRSVHASVSLWWDGRPRRSTMWCVVIVGRFYIALFSNFKQTHSTYVACDSEWVTNFLWHVFEYASTWCTCSAIWLLHGCCHIKPLLSWRVHWKSLVLV